MSERGILLRLLASIGALALGAIAVVIVSVLAHDTPGPASSATVPLAPASPAATDTTPTTTSASATTPSLPPAKTAFPAPPNGAVVFFRPNGNQVVALGVVPGNQLKLQTSVLSGEGKGVPGLGVSYRVGSKQATATPCGDGCYVATVASPNAPKAVDVRITGEKPVTWRVAMPERWPPPDASQIMSRTTNAYRTLRTLTIDDSLSSGLGRTLFTHWTIASPDKLTYQIQNGPAAVIIGPSRWDKVPGQRWVKSQQSPIHQPTPFWVTWTDAHVLSQTPTAWHVSFFDPKTPGWYALTISKSSQRPAAMRMEAASHFMTQHFSGFNAPLHIAPPK